MGGRGGVITEQFCDACMHMCTAAAVSMCRGGGGDTAVRPCAHKSRGDTDTSESESANTRVINDREKREQTTATCCVRLRAYSRTRNSSFSVRTSSVFGTKDRPPCDRIRMSLDVPGKHRTHRSGYTPGYGNASSGPCCGVLVGSLVLCSMQPLLSDRSGESSYSVRSRPSGGVMAQHHVWPPS
jgi:hypothetical protein